MLCKHQFKCFVSMFWGTGEGGSVQRWRMSDACRRLEEMPPLPAARFGKIEFPNITQLLPAGPDCVLACSSTGSIALWDHARYPSLSCAPCRVELPIPVRKCTYWVQWTGASES